tara:strand:- start:648 stop:881 length:234 start_codon:yes stop_codon:yes gene_type:complete
MGGFTSVFRSSSPVRQAVQQVAPKPAVQPAPAIRAEDDSPKYRKRRRVSGERTTILTGTQGLTASGDSTSVKTLLGG